MELIQLLIGYPFARAVFIGLECNSMAHILLQFVLYCCPELPSFGTSVSSCYIHLGRFYN